MQSLQGPPRAVPPVRNVRRGASSGPLAPSPKAEAERPFAMLRPGKLGELEKNTAARQGAWVTPTARWALGASSVAPSAPRRLGNRTENARAQPNSLIT